jgi:hypothetical protein
VQQPRATPWVLRHYNMQSERLQDAEDLAPAHNAAFFTASSGLNKIFAWTQTLRSGLYHADPSDLWNSGNALILIYNIF